MPQIDIITFGSLVQLSFLYFFFLCGLIYVFFLLPAVNTLKINSKVKSFLYFNTIVVQKTTVGFNGYSQLWLRKNMCCFFIFDPLEQFELVKISGINFGYSFTFLNSVCLFFCLYLIIKLFFFTLAQIFFKFQYKRSCFFKQPTSKIVFTYVYFFFKSLLLLVFLVVKENVITKSQKYFPFIFVVFIFIFSCNLFGIIPYTFTITGSFIVTSFLSWMSLIGITIIGILNNKWSFFNIFLPQGSPFVITPLLIILECISYIAKGFSLSIRLFANMMSGHALLKILIGFSWTLLVSFHSYSILPWIIVFLVTGVEIFIAFLQSYVFVILVAIYLNDCINIH
jgi:ATP synthase subunit 6